MQPAGVSTQPAARELPVLPASEAEGKKQLFGTRVTAKHMCFASCKKYLLYSSSSHAGLFSSKLLGAFLWDLIYNFIREHDVSICLQCKGAWH